MKKTLFNNGWMYANSSGSSLMALMGGIGEPPVPVTLPHDCVIGTERVNDPAYTSVGFFKGENVHYTKEFNVNKEDLGKCVWLEFEGVYQQAYIYVNNAYADQLPYGYGNYYVDIARFLVAGKNTIKVMVKNSPISGRWYTGGGIYRDVQLYIANLLHIKCEGTRVSAEDIEEGQATLRVVVPMKNAGSGVVDAFVFNEVLDAKGNVVASAQAPVTFLPHEEKELRLRMYVPNPKLWDEYNPYLYTIRTTLKANGEESDSFEGTFGIRKLQLDFNSGLRINGKPVKLRGGCVHRDSGILGVATFGNAEERRVRKLKEAGFNAIRSSHYPISKGMLRACDKLGVYIMDEFSDVWTTTKADFDYGMRFAHAWERDVTNMVLKDYNHPSVIMYSIGNEIPENGNKFDADWGKKLTDKIRSLDDTRYVLNSANIMLAVMNRMDEIMASFGVQSGGGQMEINTMMEQLGGLMNALNNHPIASAATEEAFAQVDIAGYNYAEDRYEPDHKMYPNRILVGSETTSPKLAKNWALVKKLPNVIGDFVWTAWDYLGEVGIGRTDYEGSARSFMGAYPWRIAYCGTIDINGFRQPVSYWRETVWGLRDEPYISVCPPEHFGKKIINGMWNWTDSRSSWNWKGYEGKPIAVEVYSDADEVELFVNGKSVGVKKPGEQTEFTAKFDTTYEPGEVKAIARKGKKSFEHVVRTAKDETVLQAEGEQKSLKAAVDVGHVNITIMDKDGIVNPEQNVRIHVDVEGGELVGLGSGAPATEENYKAPDCETFEGRALAIVRAYNPGKMNVTITAEGFKPQTVHFNIE